MIMRSIKSGNKLLRSVYSGQWLSCYTVSVYFNETVWLINPSYCVGFCFFVWVYFFIYLAVFQGQWTLTLKRWKFVFFSTEFQMFCSCFCYLRLVLHVPIYIYWPRFVFLYNFIRRPRPAWIDFVGKAWLWIVFHSRFAFEKPSKLN